MFEITWKNLVASWAPKQKIFGSPDKNLVAQQKSWDSHQDSRLTWNTLNSKNYHREYGISRSFEDEPGTDYRTSHTRQTKCTRAAKIIIILWGESFHSNLRFPLPRNAWWNLWFNGYKFTAFSTTDKTNDAWIGKLQVASSDWYMPTDGQTDRQTDEQTDGRCDPH